MFSGKALQGRIAIVTGAGRGIGEAVARAYGAQDVKVAVAVEGVNLEAAEKVAEVKK